MDNLTPEEAHQRIWTEQLHAWYSNQHDLKSGGALYEGLDGKYHAVTFVCWSKERGEKWIENSKFTDYQYIGLVTTRFIDEYGGNGVNLVVQKVVMDKQQAINEIVNDLPAWLGRDPDGFWEHVEDMERKHLEQLSEKEVYDLWIGI